MLPRPDHPSLDALYAGRCTLAELDEWLATQDMPRVLVSVELDDERELLPLKYLGEQRKWRDVKCRCDRPLPCIEWYGQDEPLAQWCMKCGRVMHRPVDRRYALSAEDRELAQPTVEVGIVAEAVR